MREVKLQIVEVEVDNVVKLRLQCDSRLGRVTSTRILDQNLRKTIILDNCLCICTFTTATFDDHSRSGCVTTTRVGDLNLRKNRGIEELQVNWEGNFRFQGIVMRITETKLIILQSSDLTDILTSQEDRCAFTLFGDDDGNRCTRSSKSCTQDTRDSVNIDASSGITFTRISYGCFSDGARSDFIVKFNCNGCFTTFTIASDINLTIDARCILGATIVDDQFFNLTEGSNIRNNRQFLIESTRRNQFDAINRSDCSCGGRGVEGIRIIKLVIDNVSSIPLRLFEKREFEGLVSRHFRDLKSALEGSCNNVNEGIAANRGLISGYP